MDDAIDAQGCPDGCDADCEGCPAYTPETIDRDAPKWEREQEPKEGN